jgi:hypothetical protein
MNTSYERIQRIDWKRVGTNVSESHLQKFNEFRKLAAGVCWRQNMRPRFPFVDPREVLNQPSPGEPTMPTNTALDELPFAKLCVKRYLLASELADQGIANASELQQAYERLLDIFEDGGSLVRLLTVTVES